MTDSIITSPDKQGGSNLKEARLNKIRKLIDELAADNPDLKLERFGHVQYHKKELKNISINELVKNLLVIQKNTPHSDILEKREYETTLQELIDRLDGEEEIDIDDVKNILTFLDSANPNHPKIKGIQRRIEERNKVEKSIVLKNVTPNQLMTALKKLSTKKA